MSEIEEVADRCLWIGLGLLFCGKYESYRPWVPMLWMLPWMVIRTYRKLVMSAEGPGQ